MVREDCSFITEMAPIRRFHIWLAQLMTYASATQFYVYLNRLTPVQHSVLNSVSKEKVVSRLFQLGGSFSVIVNF